MFNKIANQANSMTVSIMSDKKTAKIMRIITTVLAVLSMVMMVAFAEGDTSGAGDNITAGIKDGLGQIYSLLTAIVLPIAAICLAVAAFEFFLAGERGAEKAKKILLYTIIGIALVYLAPVVVSAISSWFESSSNTAGVFN